MRSRRLGWTCALHAEELAVTDTSEAFEVLSTDADSARVQAHLDKLIAQMLETAKGLRDPSPG
jgi:hypothetical protein